MAKKIIYSIPAIIFCALIILAGAYLLSDKDPSAIQSPLINKKVPDFKSDSSSNAEIKGPAIINFFASWCIPCEAEHSIIKSLSNSHKIYGINYKDDEQDQKKFLKRLGNPYEKIVNDADGSIAISFGVYGVPSSFLIDENNIIIERYDAPLTLSELDIILEKMK